MIIEKCIVKIGGKRTEVAREDIRKLKFILDGLGVMHIIDGVTFFGAFDGDKRIAGKDGSVSLKDGFGHRGRFDCREMIIPYFYEIDVMSVAQLDYEEAEFIGDMLYGTEY